MSLFESLIVGLNWCRNGLAQILPSILHINLTFSRAAMPTFSTTFATGAAVFLGQQFIASSGCLLRVNAADMRLDASTRELR